MHSTSSILSFCFLFFLFILLLNGTSYSIGINRVEITGNTIELDIAGYLKGISGELSEKDINSLGIKLTNEYHDKGYTTSFVEKLIIENGVLEIRVKESKILGINITGISGREKDEIQLSLDQFFLGKIYNRFSMEKHAMEIKRKYNLESVKIYPVNYAETSDVFLSVRFTGKSKGSFYGGIGFEPIYGISPELGYYYPFTNTALDILAAGGYRDGKVRKAGGDIRYFLFPDNDPHGIYIGTNLAYYVEHWESRDSDYKRSSLAPVIGYRSVLRHMILDLYFNEIISHIEDYKTNGDSFRDYDTRITLELGFSNKADLLSVKDSTDIRLSAAAGRSDLNENGYVLSSGELKAALSPLAGFRITPKIYSCYTTSGERYFWQYVYDKRLLGFFDDFSASKWKNTAGLDIEFEIIPQFIYAGPFCNTGYFLDENQDWKSKTGGGVKSVIEFKKAIIEIYYAWNLSKSPAEGGLSVLAGGKF